MIKPSSRTGVPKWRCVPHTVQQLDGETVMAYADNFDSIAVQLNIDRDTITGLFVAGLNDAIAARLDDKVFDCFADALTAAKVVEENQQARHPLTAKRVIQTQPVLYAGEPSDSQELV